MYLVTTFCIGRFKQTAYALSVILKQIKFHYISVLITVLVALVCGISCGNQAVDKENGEAIVSSINLKPGIDLWLGEERLESEVISMIERFPLYAVHHERYAISEANLKRIRSERDAVVAALRSRIENASKKAMASPASGKSVTSLEFELTMAVDLNAVELLDVIAGTARQLHTWLVDFESRKLKTYLATSHADLHRNLLSALSGILKQEGFGPVVNEGWDSEFTFEKAQAEFSGNLLDPDTSLSDETDPRFPVAGMAPFSADFSEKLIDWAQDFLANTPETAHKGAASMVQPVPPWK
jgi:hypothetical protein